MKFTRSNLPIENEYPKLVRDYIPQIIRKRGLEPSVRIVESDEEYLAFLLKKVREEAAELEHSLVKNNMQEELADVIEIIQSILRLKNWTVEDVATVQREKREQNGGFGRRIVLLQKPEQLHK